MAALRSTLFGTSLFRIHRPLSSSNPSLPFLSFNVFPSHSSLFRRSCASTALDRPTDEDTESPSSLDQHQCHPWSEWVTFVDHLKTKGYCTQPSSSSSSSSLPVAGDGANSSTSGDYLAAVITTGNIYIDMNLVKDACLNFARDRYDVIKSLSMQHVQAVVEKGCPNLLRKAVNSAKRLRAHVRLDEDDVCGSCNMRNSCGRAYVILKESESAARTVDIVRILLFYALDPIVLSGVKKPPERELIESSVRKLFSELIELSESTLDPPPLKPAAKTFQQKKLLPNLKKAEPSGGFEMKKGDWICEGCSFVNFSRNVSCLKCKTEGPKSVSADTVEMKKGDWNCSQCGFMNFASNRKCLRCGDPRPRRQLNPGEWECPSCDFLNYKRNMVCLKCKCERPKEEPTNEYEEQLWRGSR